MNTHYRLNLSSGTEIEEELTEGSLSHPPLPGSVVIEVEGEETTETFTDNGEGVLTGSDGGSGTVDYSTGQTSLEAGAATYTREEELTEGSLSLPPVPGSVVIEVVSSPPKETYTDNGEGVLTGSEGGEATVDYSTGQTSLEAGAATYTRFRSAFQSVTDESQGTPAEEGGFHEWDETVYMAGTLANGDIIPGTVTGKLGEADITEDGNGRLSGEGILSGAVDYTTGRYAFVFTEEAAADELSFSYSYVKETVNEKLLIRNRRVRGVFKITVTPEEEDVTVSIATSPDLIDWRTLATYQVGRGIVKNYFLAVNARNVKLIGSGGQVTVSFV